MMSQFKGTACIMSQPGMSWCYEVATRHTLAYFVYLYMISHLASLQILQTFLAQPNVLQKVYLADTDVALDAVSVLSAFTSALKYRNVQNQ